jgi:hypothetical protein
MAIPKRRMAPWPEPKIPGTRPPLRRMLWAVQRLQKGGSLKATDLARVRGVGPHPLPRPRLPPRRVARARRVRPSQEELATAEVHSSTADYHELVSWRMGEAASLLSGVRPVEGQVGLLALSDGLLVAIDLVGSAATWGHLADRALRSLLPAASDPEASASRPDARRHSAEEWLRVLGAARIARRPAIGLGDDFELAADGLIGSGVWLEGHPAHLSAFAPA